jgi:hypothetical protein
MKTSFSIESILTVTVIAIIVPLAANAQPVAVPAEQQEADYRVIAARCGTPAFERAFYNQSRAAVAAGLVNKNRPPADVEKIVTALRRSPFVLVAANADCPAQLEQLADLRKSRGELIRTSRGRKSPGK